MPRRRWLATVERQHAPRDLSCRAAALLLAFAAVPEIIWAGLLVLTLR